VRIALFIFYQGDDLILECTYDSTQRANATVGGYGTSEEMCMTLLQFYPKTDDMVDMASFSFSCLPLRIEFDDSSCIS
jgi:dopamine beta-monooxygenase